MKLEVKKILTDFILPFSFIGVSSLIYLLISSKRNQNNYCEDIYIKKYTINTNIIGVEFKVDTFNIKNDFIYIDNDNVETYIPIKNVINIKKNY